MPTRKWRRAVSSGARGKFLWHLDTDNVVCKRIFGGLDRDVAGSRGGFVEPKQRKVRGIKKVGNRIIVKLVERRLKGAVVLVCWDPRGPKIRKNVNKLI